NVEPFPFDENLRIPRPVQDVIFLALSKNKEERPADAREFNDLLSDALREETVIRVRNPYLPPETLPCTPGKGPSIAHEFSALGYNYRERFQPYESVHDGEVLRLLTTIYDNLYDIPDDLPGPWAGELVGELQFGWRGFPARRYIHEIHPDGTIFF